jgi:hypothetical protein
MLPGISLLIGKARKQYKDELNVTSVSFNGAAASEAL